MKSVDRFRSKLKHWAATSKPATNGGTGLTHFDVSPLAWCLIGRMTVESDPEGMTVELYRAASPKLAHQEEPEWFDEQEYRAVYRALEDRLCVRGRSPAGPACLISGPTVDYLAEEVGNWIRDVGAHLAGFMLSEEEL